MGWTEPLYSRSKVDAAGRALFAPGTSTVDRDVALEVIGNWRSSHSFPLNTMQMALRRYSAQVAPDVLVAQRLKRLASIEAKLRRFPGRRLSQIQDLGGARAVVPKVGQVSELVDRLVSSNMRHELAVADDYITTPKDSGYRSVHLVFKYYSDRQSTYNGLRIELQIRSALQHAWATAVETVGTFTLQALKSSQGQEDWLRFFSLTGSAIALRERTPIVPGTPGTRAALQVELEDYAKRLDVIKRLKTYGMALNHIEQVSAGSEAKYFLLELNAERSQLMVVGFDSRSRDEATDRYMDAERRAKRSASNDAVLVSVDSVSALRRAYPNYFADTTAFVDIVERSLRPARSRRPRTAARPPAGRRAPKAP